jgi:hypothetical protein
MTGLRPAWLLAVSATGTAVCLSVLGGWQRGGTLSERVVWVAIGVVLVVSAHLLPTLIRGAPVAARLMGYLLWGACMVTACYGHATFFVLAQKHAGDARASAVTGDVTNIAARPARTLTPVMEERATVTHQLALARVQRCSRDCAGLDVRRVTLAARLDALNAEADDIRQQQAGRDRVMAERDALRADPVMSPLAVLLGVNTARVDVLSGLAYAAVLEGVSCLLWAVALQSRIRAAVTPEVIDPVTVSHVSVAPGRVPVSERGTETVASPAPRETQEIEVMKLARDVAAGHVRATVADIRRHKGCSQARAAALRKQLNEFSQPS